MIEASDPTKIRATRKFRKGWFIVPLAIDSLILGERHAPPTPVNTTLTAWPHAPAH